MEKFKFFITGLLLASVLLLADYAVANNVKINGIAEIDGAVGADKIATVKFKLSWENSWRDNLNWDAVYVFVKFRVDGSDNQWYHAYPEETGHSSSSPMFVFSPAKSGTNVTGLFVERKENGEGNITENEIKLRWNIQKGTRPLSQQEFADGKVDLAVFAIEMVYVPYGAFVLGDGVSASSFCMDGGAPFLVGGDNVSTKIKVGTNDSLVLASSYPKGYNGFYCMKYEVSQEQYVRFLNKLTYAEQKQRVGNDLTTLKEGEFVFGNPNEPSYRNGIVVQTKETNQPVVFGHDLNKNKTYGEEEDGQTIACNYLTPQDMLAYCSWAGLRPMSELEYEKACRLSSADLANPVEGGYAWNGDHIISRAGGVMNGGRPDEKPDKGNVNAGNTFGPVRCGAFATSTTRQEEAGASSWGIMEMSGNLAELCYSANNSGTAFIANHGLGMVNTALSGWPVNANQFAVRGGSFASADAQLRVSDRTNATGNYFKDINQRDSTVTFRAVHTFTNGDSVEVSAGKIVCANGKLVDTVCTETGILYIINESAATNASGYVWYVKGQKGTWEVVNGQFNSSLTFTGLDGSAEYSFKRKAICAMGDAFSNEVKIVSPQVSLNATDLVLKNCIAASATATLGANGSITWLMDDGSGKVLKNDAGVMTSTYTPGFIDMGISPGTEVNTTIICRGTVGGCVAEKKVNVSIIPSQSSLKLSGRPSAAVAPKISTPIILTVSSAEAKVMWYFNGKEVLPKPLTGSVTPTYAPTYSVFKSGGSHILTAKAELNGCVATHDVLVHVTDSVKALNCPATVTDEDDTDKNTYTVRKMADGRCWMITNLRRTDRASKHAGSPANDAAHGCHYTWTTAMEGSTAERARGICPKGWHIPAADEWKNLEMALASGFTIAVADGTGGRGSHMSAMTASGGLNLTFSTYGGSEPARYGYYWTSTENSTSAYYYMVYNGSNAVTYATTAKGGEYSVRCVMD